MKTKEIAINIVKRLVEKGHIAYFTGGWVRDFLLKVPSDDIDIATSASVDEIRSLFSKTIPVGIAFGIVVVVEEGHNFEVATFRVDKEYPSGRRPLGFVMATPEEDAMRRDFTINGMFYDPLQDKVIDYVHGREDLKNRLIKAIGDPNERFSEDRLRMMRAVRYATRFGFVIEEKTKAAIKKHAHTLFPAVAMERVWQEFCKMSKFANFAEGLFCLYELDLLAIIFPELKDLSIEEVRKRTDIINKLPPGTSTIIELLELFAYKSLDGLNILADYLKLSSKERGDALFFHKAKALFEMPKEWLKKLELVEWAYFYADSRSESALKVIAARYSDDERIVFLQEHQQLCQKLDKSIVMIRDKKPLVTAIMLQEAGIVPGKEMGRLLKEAERIAINQQIDDPQVVLRKLKL